VLVIQTSILYITIGSARHLNGFDFVATQERHETRNRVPNFGFCGFVELDETLLRDSTLPNRNNHPKVILGVAPAVKDGLHARQKKSDN